MAFPVPICVGGGGGVGASTSTSGACQRQEQPSSLGKHCRRAQQCSERLPWNPPNLLAADSSDQLLTGSEWQMYLYIADMHE